MSARLLVVLALGTALAIVLLALPLTLFGEPELGGWHTYADSMDDSLGAAAAYNDVRDQYLVAWDDYGSTEISVYAQVAAADGSKVSGTITIAHYYTYSSTEPAVAYDGQRDRYLVVYVSDSKPSLPPYHDYDPSGQLVNGDGTLGDASLLSANTNHQRRPDVAYNPIADEYLVVWQEEQGTGGLWDIWACRVRASDLYDHPRVNIATGSTADPPDTEDRVGPSVAWAEATNKYLIAYTREGGHGDIFAKLVNADLSGASVAPELRLIDNIYDQRDVSVAGGFDQYLAVWQDGPSATDRTVYARRVAADGSMGQPFRLDPTWPTTPTICFDPDVSFAGCRYLAVWSHAEASPPPANADTYGRWVLPWQDHPYDEPFSIASDTSPQVSTTVACDWYGDCLYVESDLTGLGNYDLFGRTISPWTEDLSVPVILRLH